MNANYVSSTVWGPPYPLSKTYPSMYIPIVVINYECAPHPKLLPLPYCPLPKRARFCLLTICQLLPSFSIPPLFKDYSNLFCVSLRCVPLIQRIFHLDSKWSFWNTYLTISFTCLKDKLTAPTRHTGLCRLAQPLSPAVTPGLTHTTQTLEFPDYIMLLLLLSRYFSIFLTTPLTLRFII